MNSTYPKKGVLELDIYRNGELVEHFKDHNVIVNDARTAMAKLIAEGDPDSVITQIGIGSSTDEATVADSSIHTPILTKNLEGHTYPDEHQVKFTFIIDVSEANGQNISEFGLITKGGKLFARKVRGSIAKDQDIAIAGSWTIIF